MVDLPRDESYEPPVAETPEAPLGESSAASSDEAAAQISDARLQARTDCEALACRVLEALEADSFAVVLLPWGSGSPPDGVLCPKLNETCLDSEYLQEAVRGKSIGFVSCSLETDEKDAAVNIIRQLDALTPKVFILAGQVAPLTHEASDRIDSSMHEAILTAGADDLLTDLPVVPAQLRLRLKVAYDCYKTQTERLRLVLSREPQLPPKEEVESLMEMHEQLHFRDIPRALMPEFTARQDDLVEADTGVGEYTFTGQMQTMFGSVYEGKDALDAKVAVKCWEKTEISAPGEVEGIYRELRFLRDFIRHPHIVRGQKFLHGKKKLYFVMEFVGKQNMSQHLAGLPGLRMCPADALSCFYKIADALSYCHGKGIFHRTVSLEHIVLGNTPDGSSLPKLVDFHYGVFSKKESTSQALVGSLPCMAPEMLCDESYKPKFADCWSIAIVLLEMVGGKGSLFAATGLLDPPLTAEQLEEHDDRRNIGSSILGHFQEAGSHSRALAKIGEVHDEQVLEILMALIRPPAERADLKGLIPTEVAESIRSVLDTARPMPTGRPPSAGCGPREPTGSDRPTSAGCEP